MRLINRIICFNLRNVRSRKQTKTEEQENVSVPSGEYEKIRFTEDELTEMGQYRMKAKSRHFKDIFKDKMEERMEQEYLKKQKDNMFS